MGCFSAPSTEKQSSSSSAAKTDAQTKGLDKMLDIYLKEAGQGASIFPGSRVSPFSTLQKDATADVGNFRDTFSQPTTVGTPLKGEVESTTKALLGGELGGKEFTKADTDAYFKSVYQDPAMKSLQEDILPGVDEAYAGPGFWNAARSHEKVDRTQDTTDLLTSQRGALNWDVLGMNQGLAESKAGRAQAAVNQGIAVGQVPAQEVRNNLEIAAKQVAGLDALFGFGQREQTQAQVELQDEIMKFAQENQLTDPDNLAVIMGLLGLDFRTSTQQGTTSTSGAGLGYVGASSALGSFGDVFGGKMATL